MFGVFFFNCDELLKKLRRHSVRSCVPPSVCPLIYFSVLGVLSGLKVCQWCFKNVLGVFEADTCRRFVGNHAILRTF